MYIPQVARMSGTGGQLYSALTNKRPSEAQMLKAQLLFCEHLPFIQVPHVFANHAIMEAFKGAPRVHVIDYGILYGVQWPCLLWQLSQRPGGPPHLRITGVTDSSSGAKCVRLHVYRALKILKIELNNGLQILF